MKSREMPGSPDVAENEVARREESSSIEHAEMTAAERAEAEKDAEDELSGVREQITAGPVRKEDAAFGDFAGADVRDGQITLPAAETKFLHDESIKFFEEVKDAKVATSKGYKVAAAYDAHVQGWTTQTRIVELPGGKRVFLLCSYPAGAWRRRSDRLMEWVSGDPMRKPKPQEWKGIVESRSNIPTIAGAPEGIVAMPYVESINAYDIFSHQKDIQDFGPFDWAKEMTEEDKINLLPDMVGALRETHESGRTWGEAILPNFILTKDKRTILIDPETTYEKDVPLADQRAMDVRNFLTSVCGSLARAHSMEDFRPIVKSVIERYSDPETIQALKAICEEKLSFRQKLFFNIFTKFRNGSTDLKEFERVREAIVEAISALSEEE